MTPSDAVQLLVEATATLTAGVLLAIALRRMLRRRFGAGVAYAAWWLVPASLLAVLLPAGHGARVAGGLRVVVLDSRLLSTPADGATDLPGWVTLAWAAGAVAMAVWLGWQQRRFERGLGRLRAIGDGIHVAETSVGLPAAMGVWRPRVVLPEDFHRRYGASEQALLLAHEREHIAAGDLHWNALAVVLRCVFWFHPLLPVAVRALRHDQELACDQRVLQRHPASRRAYGEAMFKTQLAAWPLPLGCHWGHGHPLKERIEMLRKPVPSRTRRFGGHVLVVVLTTATAATAWAAQPQSPRPAAPASSAARSPASVESEVQGVRMTAPAYPAQAAQAGIGGRVVLQIDIDAAGRPTAVTVARSQPAGVFDANAVEAAWQWRFEPMRRDGNAVPSRVQVPVDFEPPAKPKSASAAGAGGRLRQALVGDWEFPPRSQADIRASCNGSVHFDDRANRATCVARTLAASGQ